MSEMVERVAEAVWQAQKANLGNRPTEVTRAIARAAIEAMRVPTGDMIREGDDCCGVSCHALRTWQEMIDAALK